VHLKRRDHACPCCPGIAFGEKGSLTKHVNHAHLKIPRRAKLDKSAVPVCVYACSLVQTSVKLKLMFEQTVCVLEIDAVLFVEPTVEIGWDRIFLLF
jgi:hypothetical protein